VSSWLFIAYVRRVKLLIRGEQVEQQGSQTCEVQRDDGLLLRGPPGRVGHAKH